MFYASAMGIWRVLNISVLDMNKLNINLIVKHRRLTIDPQIRLRYLNKNLRQPSERNEQYLEFDF